MGNITQTLKASRKPQEIFSFQAINYTGTDGTLNVAADTNVAVTQRVMPYAGSVFAVAVSLGGTISGGTLTHYPTINGATLTNLAVVHAPSEQYDYSKVDGRVYRFVAGDRLGVVYIDASATPDNSRDGIADVYVMFEDVEI